MAINQKWSEKPQITSAAPTDSVCILSPGKGQPAPMNKLIKIEDLLKNNAVLINPAGGQNNYAPIANPTFTGVVSVPSSGSEHSLHAVNFQKLQSYVPAGEESYLEKYLYKNSDGFNIWQAITAATIGLGNVTNESKATMFTNPTFTGTVTAPTPTSTDNSTKVATTAFVNNNIKTTNPIVLTGTLTSDGSPNIVGVGTNFLSFSTGDVFTQYSGPQYTFTIISIQSDTSLTASANVSFYPGMTGTITRNSNTTVPKYANAHNPIFTGNVDMSNATSVTAPTPTSTDNSTKVATTAFVNSLLNGTNYIMVYGKGTPTENAIELQAVYNAAKTMSPLASNRVTVIVAPGEYDFGAAAFVHDTQYIDIVSLTGEADVFISSDEVNTNFAYTFGIKVTAYDSKVKGINCVSKTFFIASNLDNLVCDTCIGGNNSFGSYGGTISGTFKDCIGGNASFGSYGSIALGTFINCTGGNDSFCTDASGKFKNCTGGNSSFGAYTTAPGTFTNCTGGNDSFGGAGGTIAATARLYNCRLTSGTFVIPQSGGRLILCIDGSNNIVTI